MRQMMLPLARGLASPGRSPSIFGGKRRPLGLGAAFGLHGAPAPGAGASGEALPCAVCGGGGIGRTCGWCRVLGASGGDSRGSRAMMPALARFNTSLLLEPLAPAAGAAPPGPGAAGAAYEPC
jgi:hypothetical protein